MKIENNKEINLFVLRHLQQTGELDQLDIQTLLALSMESGFAKVVVDQDRLAVLTAEYGQLSAEEMRDRKRMNEMLLASH